MGTEKSVLVAAVDVAGRRWIRFWAMMSVLVSLLLTLRTHRSIGGYGRRLRVCSRSSWWSRLRKGLTSRNPRNAQGFAIRHAQGHQITITGVITELDWATPHTYVYVDVKGASGKMETWAVECNGIWVLLRSGWNRGMLAPGTAVSIIANQPWSRTALADKIHLSLAGERFKSGHYLAAGCTTTGTTQRQLGYGPPCLQDAVELLRRSWRDDRNY